MDVETAEERRSFLTPARLLVGSLIGGAGIALLGFFLGGTSASAAEPAPSDPAAHSVLSAAGSVVSEVGGVVPGAVAPVVDVAGTAARSASAVVPAPVHHAVSPATSPVASAVRAVAAVPPVTQVVSPLTTAVDDVLNSIPLTHDLLGTDPIGTVVPPSTQIVDSTVGAVVGTGGFAVAATGVSTVVTSPSGLQSVLAGSSVAHAVTGWAGSAPRAPDAPGGGATPYDQPAISGSGASVSGAGAAAPAVAVPTSPFALSAAMRGTRGCSTDDRLPVSAVADHDTSPD